MPAVCLAPTSLAAARAARRLCDAQDGVLFGPDVTTLDRIVPLVLASAGDRRPVLPQLAERLVVAAAGREAGGPFADLSPDAGLAAALASSIAELRRAEVEPEDARVAAEGLSGAPAARLRALAGALEAYEARLRATGALDRAGATRAAASAARRGRTPWGAELDLLVVSGLTATSPGEWDLVASLAGLARRSRFHLPFFADRPDLCAPAEPLLRRVEGLHELAARRELEVVLGHADGDGRAALPSALLAALAGGRARAASGGGRVFALAGAGEEGEDDAAAKAVERLLEAGLGPEEIAVVAPSPRGAAPGLARACAARGIPFAAGRGPPLADVAPVRLVAEALAAASAPSRASLERLSASTYLAPLGIDAPLASLLDRAGAIDGRASPAEAIRRRAAGLSAPSASRERALLERAVAGLDRLALLLRPLGVTGTARDHVRRLQAFVDGAGIRRRAARAPRDVAARDLGALLALEEAADGLARALALAGRGEERLEARTWRDLLALAVEAAAAPAPPEAAAGAVELWGLDEAPGLSVRGAVLVGCADGAWPPMPAPEPLLRDPERVAVARRLRRAALPTAPSRRAESVHRAFCAVAAARDAVAFTWAAPGPSGRGGPLASMVADAFAAIGLASPASPDPEAGLATARTTREALRAAARLGRSGAAALAGTPLAERAACALARGGVEDERREALHARRAAAHAGALGVAATAALAASLPLEWSPTQLETFARCPFRLFLQLGARLPDPEVRDLDQDGRDEGSLLHAVLERFVAERMGRRAWPPSGGAEDLAEARLHAERIFARFEAEGRTGDPAVWAARREAVLARVERIVRAEARDHEGLAPALVEHRFGGTSGAPPVEVEAQGEIVRLKGRIDRVDASGERLLVIDYKNARQASAYAELLLPESMGKTSFQVPAYLLAAGRALPGRATLAATYALLRKAERVKPFVAAAEGAERARGPFAEGVVDVVRRVRGGDFPIASRGCESCAFGAVCRVEGIAVDPDDGSACAAAPGGAGEAA